MSAAQTHEEIAQTPSTPHEISRQDLISQRRMASSTEDMSRWTLFQIFFSAATIIGLGWTILLTRKSLQAANASLADAVESTQLTRLSLDQNAAGMAQAQENAKAQMRAYLGFDDIENVVLDPFNIAVCWRIKNFGVTPASQVKIQSWLDWISSPVELNPEASSVSDAKIKNGYDIAPGACVRIWGHSESYDQEFIDLVIAGKAQIMLSLELRYEDAFGEDRIFQFAQTRWGKNLQYFRQAVFTDKG